MGGPLRTEVRAYATGLYRTEGDPLHYLPEEAAGYAAEGFHAVKLKVGFGVAEDAAITRAVHETIGPDTGLMVDANHAYDAVSAVRLGRMIEPLDIGWFEEPVPLALEADRESAQAVQLKPQPHRSRLPTSLQQAVQLLLARAQTKPIRPAWRSKPPVPSPLDDCYNRKLRPLSPQRGPSCASHHGPPMRPKGGWPSASNARTRRKPR
jgi:hypothetical protein